MLRIALTLLVTWTVGAGLPSPSHAQSQPDTTSSPEAAPDVDDAAEDRPVQADAAPDATDGALGPSADGASPDEPTATTAAPTTATAAPTTATVAPSPTPDMSDARGGIDEHGGSLHQDDVAPTVDVFRNDEFALRIGGLMQVHFAPYVGDDSLLDNDDIATREGFRLRRARFGFEGLLGPQVKLLLVVNPLDSDSETGTVSDARLSLKLAPELKLAVGTGKVPFTRAELGSSRSLATIERPLSVRDITPDRRLGVSLEGELAGRVNYLAAFMNATEGYDDGNDQGGFLYVGRVQFAAFGDVSAGGSGAGLSLGLGGFIEDGPATTNIAASVDIALAMSSALIKLEGLCERRDPKDDPVTSGMVADNVDRCGAYVEASYTLPTWSLQPVVRAEFYDDDRSLEDAGDSLLISAGVNARIYDYTRVQLHYLMRLERHGTARSNDAAVLSLQGDF